MRELMIHFYLQINYLSITHGDALFDMPERVFVFCLQQMLTTMMVCMASMWASFHGTSDHMNTQIAAFPNNYNLVLL